MAETTSAPSDVAQTLFTIPKEILDAFSGIGKTIIAVQKFDYIGFAFVVVGLGFIFLALAMISLDEGAKEVLSSPAVTASVKALAGNPSGAAKSVQSVKEAD